MTHGSKIDSRQRWRGSGQFVGQRVIACARWACATVRTALHVRLWRAAAN